MWRLSTLAPAAAATRVAIAAPTTRAAIRLPPAHRPKPQPQLVASSSASFLTPHFPVASFSSRNAPPATPAVSDAARTADVASSAGAPPLAAAASSASPPTAPPASDAGAEFEFADTAPKVGTWRRNVAALVLLGGILYHMYESRQAAAALLSREVVSCGAEDVFDLLSVFHFTTRDLESVYAKTVSRFPRGVASVDAFATLLGQQVALVRERRRREREARASQRAKDQYLDDREEVVLERRIARAQKRGDQSEFAALRQQLDELVKRNEGRESSRERETTADALEAEADDHADNKFVPIDTYTFFRTCIPRSYSNVGGARTPMLDVRDLLVGVSLLAFDHAPLEQRWEERKGQRAIPESMEELERSWNTRDKEVFTRDSHSRLHFAFRVADEDRDGMLTLAQLEQLIVRLVRTGHIEPASIVQHRRTLNPSSAAAVLPVLRSSSAFVPWESEVASAREMAAQLWQHVAHQRRSDAIERIRAQADQANAPVESLPPLPSTSFDPAATLSWPELLAAARHSTNNKQGPAFWYLYDTYPVGSTTGAFYRWRQRRKADFRFLRRWLPTEEEAAEVDHAVQTFLV